MGAHSRPEDILPEPEWEEEYGEKQNSYGPSTRYTSTKMFREIEGIHVQSVQHRSGELEDPYNAEFSHVRRELAYLRTTVAASNSGSGVDADLMYVRDDIVELRSMLEADQARMAILLSRGEELCRQLLDLIAALQHNTRSMNAQRDDV